LATLCSRAGSGRNRYLHFAPAKFRPRKGAGLAPNSSQRWTRVPNVLGEPVSFERYSPRANGHAPAGAAAYRVLYRSTGLRDEPSAVSGVIGGRPIVAWTHPTSGIVPRCAPSLTIFHFQKIQALRKCWNGHTLSRLLNYPGLGIAGPHPYLVGSVKRAQ
jgi:hypothetical protein